MVVVSILLLYKYDVLFGVIFTGVTIISIVVVVVVVVEGAVSSSELRCAYHLSSTAVCVQPLSPQGLTSSVSAFTRVDKNLYSLTS